MEISIRYCKILHDPVVASGCLPDMFPEAISEHNLELPQGVCSCDISYEEFQALVEKVDLIEASLCIPEEEICDGIDNDCNGEVDEGLMYKEEVCGDDLDNDCDGLVDENCATGCGCNLNDPLVGDVCVDQFAYTKSSCTGALLTAGDFIPEGTPVWKPNYCECLERNEFYGCIDLYLECTSVPIIMTEDVCPTFLNDLSGEWICN